MTEYDIVQAMPHSPSAEEAVIGSLLIDQEMIERVKLDPSDFYIVRNRWVYEAILKINATHGAVDYLTVCKAIEASGKLSEIGGVGYVMQLISRTPSSQNAESYAGIVAECAKRRKIIRVANDLANQAFKADSDLEKAISATMEELSGAVITSDHELKPISYFLDQVYYEVQDAFENPRDIFGLPTGLPDIDKLTGGIELGTVWKLSGPPGLGKSLLSAQIMWNMAKSSTPVGIFEVEMPGKQVTRREISNASKITTWALKTGRITPDQMQGFFTAYSEMYKLPVYMADGSDVNTQQIRSSIIRAVDKYGIKCVMIDYEEKVQPARWSDNPIERSRIVSEEIHGIFTDLNLAGLVINRMNKAGVGGQQEGQAKLAGASGVIYDADVIWILNETNDKNVVRMVCEKFREGRKDIFVDLVRVPNFPSFACAQRSK